MADNKNNEVAPASTVAAPVETAAPVTVVRERRAWASPIVTVLAVVLALVVGGVGGFAIARASGPGGVRPAMEQGQLPGGPGGQQQGQQGPQQGQQGQQGPQQGPGGQQGQPPRPGDGQDAPTAPPSDDSGDTGN